MDKDLEKLSALYDGELSSKEIQESLTRMHADDGLKRHFPKLWAYLRHSSKTFGTKNFKSFIFERLPQQD